MEIDGEQRAASLRGKQVPLLLAYFLLHRERPVGRDELIGAIWPDRAPESEDAALRTLLSRLRSALGSDRVMGRDELVVELPTPVWIDFEAARLEVERAAGALEAGDARRAWALAQVPLNIAGRGLLPGAQAAWLDPPRRELEDIRLRALEVLGRSGLSLGRAQLGSVERAARALIDAEPYRESGYVLLMQVLAAGGNVAEALRVFERLRVLLRDELGTLPSPETIAAHESLLRPRTRNAASEASPADKPSVSGLPLPPELLARAHTPLVGREREFRELNDLWTKAREVTPRSFGAVGAQLEGRLVLLSGDAGIGKTRIVAEFAQRVHADGAYVLAGRSPQDALLPYQPFVESLRHYVIGVPFTDLRASAREYGSELARLVPELRRQVPDLPPPPDSDPDIERYRLFEAVVGLLREMSETAPVLLVLDDLQWAARPTLLLLRHVVRAPELSRVLILGSYRSTEADTNGFGEALGELRRERLVTQIRVDGLSEPETAELIRLRAGRPPTAALARALHAETEGNPFFIEEIVRHLADAGVRLDLADERELERAGLPEGVKEVIARRLSRLDTAAVEWLRVAAVIGRDFELSLLEQVLSTDEDEFLNALEAALAAGLVVEPARDPGRYLFSHALIRETLYDGMSVPRRARTHRRVGEALEARGDDADLAALALHFTRAAEAQDAERAIEYGRRAGAQATEMLAHELAVAQYAQALEAQERFEPGNAARRLELLLALGEARVRAGERPQAWEIFREAAEIAARLGDSSSLARAAIGATRRYIQPPGVVDEHLIALLEHALELTAGDRTLVRVALLGRLCGALYYSSQRERMVELAAEATAIADELRAPEAGALAASARRRAVWDPSHLEQRLSDATELLTLGREAGDLELTLQGHAWLVVDLLEHGEADAVEAQIEAFVAGAERLRQPLYHWNAEIWRAMRAFLGGDLDEAERRATQALSLGAHSETITAQQYHALQLLVIRREQGRMAELEAPLRQLVQDNPHRPAWRAALAALLCETGQSVEARGELEILAEQGFQDIPQDADWMTTVTLLADVCADLNDPERAERLYAMLAPYEEANVVIALAAICMGSAARYLGRLAATTGKREQAARHFVRALEADIALKAPVWVAHTQLEYAHLLDPSSVQGRELMQAAVRNAEKYGLAAVARRAKLG